MDSNMIEKLKSMLDDPATLNMLSEVLGSMTNPAQANPTPQPSSENAESDVQQQPSVSSNIADQADIMMKIKDVMSSVSADSDPRINLLHSLKPYMRPARCAKMDQAIKLIQIAKIASVFKL